MKTLKSLTIIALAAMSLSSCQKNNPAEIVPEGYKKVNFTLGTRASGTESETAVNKVQISVFDNNGKYVAGKSGDGSQISMNVPVGVSNFYVCALANGADNNIYKIPNLDTLKKEGRFSVPRAIFSKCLRSRTKSLCSRNRHVR